MRNVWMAYPRVESSARVKNIHLSSRVCGCRLVALGGITSYWKGYLLPVSHVLRPVAIIACERMLFSSVFYMVTRKNASSIIGYYRKVSGHIQCPGRCLGYVMLKRKWLLCLDWFLANSIYLPSRRLPDIFNALQYRLGWSVLKMLIESAPLGSS